MPNKLYVANISFKATADDLRELFEEHGFVPTSVNIINDRETGRSKGFGFVEVEPSDFERAKSAMNGAEFQGRNLTVDEARPPVKKESRDYSSRR